MKRIICLSFFVVILISCTTQKETTKEDNTQLRFDGIYYREFFSHTEYYRFFNTGKVITVLVVGKFDKAILRWFNEDWNDSTGFYSLDNNKVTFSINLEKGSIDYNGIITSFGLILNSHSNITGHGEENKIILFKKFD
jgi:hypothetical protein